ncbi:MAG: undecaprenyl-diphosphate phosphatase [Patescibacteria group bacterium]
MFEGIVLGIIQGVTEWLPISSEGILVLVKTNFFSQGESARAMIEFAFFLHLGTFAAALLYLRKDVLLLAKALFAFHKANPETKKIFRFLFVSTLLTGIIGFFVLEGFIRAVDAQSLNITEILTFGIGILLLGTAFVQIKAKKGGVKVKSAKDLNDGDGVLLGVLQGFSALPGLSRSGLTVSALLLRKFDDETALRLSFLMSLPAVLGANILFHNTALAFTPTALWGVLFSFFFGLLAIHVLLTLARKFNFGYFVLLFAFFTILSAFV